MYVYAPNQTVQTYPYTERQFREDNPLMLVPRLSAMTEERRNAFGIYTVTPVAKPVAIGSKVEEATPVWNVDHFEQAWTVTPYTQPEYDGALLEAKAIKLSELKAEAIARISSQFPDLDNVGSIMLERERWLSISAAARQPTADYQRLIDVAAVFTSTRSQLAAQTDLAAVVNYDVSTGPAWP